MENKSFKWLLRELTTRRTKLSILDTYLCAGELVKDAFRNDAAGSFRATAQKPKKVKHLLNELLESKCPLLQEYTPDKLICVVYLGSQVRTLTARAIAEIPAARVYSMRFKSIHVLLEPTVALSIYKVLSVSKHGDLFCTFKKLHTIGKDAVLRKDWIRQKAKEVTSAIGELVQKSSGSLMNRVTFDIAIDGKGNCYLLKASKIKLFTGYVPEQKRLTTAAMPPPAAPHRAKHVTQLLPFNRENSVKFTPSPRHYAGGNHDFVEMLAKTIERERKSESPPGTLFKHLSSDCIASIDQLLEEIEGSRPRIWAKDLVRKKTKKSTGVSRSPAYHSTETSAANSPRLPNFHTFSHKLCMYKQSAERRKLHKHLNSARGYVSASPSHLSSRN